MAVTLKFWTNGKVWEIDVPKYGYKINEPAMIGYHETEWKIISLGETEAQASSAYAERQPTKWEEIRSACFFIYPFDVQAFEPEFCLKTFEYYERKAKRDCLKVWNFVFTFGTKWNLDINIERYAEIPRVRQGQLNYMLRSMNKQQIQDISLNGLKIR